MSIVGGYLEYRGVFSAVGDIMINVGGYLEYRGGFHIMMHTGDIMSTVGVFSTMGNTIL